jgi:predicted ribosome quality control (RQC) complex YloA/Tae2 family protein
MDPTPAPTPEQAAAERQAEIVRALKKHRQKMQRKLEAVRGDLAEAERAPALRRRGEALLAYLRQVPARAARVALPDPHAPERTLDIALDPAVSGQVNAARYFKRAAKAERALTEIPPRIAALEGELMALAVLLDRVETALSEAAAGHGRGAPVALGGEVAEALESALRALPPALRVGIPRAPGCGAGGGAGTPGGAKRPPTGEAVARGHARAPSARLQPRRFRTREGWDVLVGRNNDGNDYVSHVLARPEDYWFHVHGCPGSHVVLRRGKGKNEPSKQTLEEVASWAAFFSQARTAGKVPVIWTLKKYVRKPRGGKPGLAMCEREKMIMVRPVEPTTEATDELGETA